MSLYSSYLRTVDNPLHDRSTYADWLLPDQVKRFRECFDSTEAYRASLFSDPNLKASAHDTHVRIDEFVRVTLGEENPLVVVELCIVMETYVKRSLKHNLSGFLAVALRAYIALFKSAGIAASDERREWRLYHQESKEHGYYAHEVQDEELLSAEVVAESSKEHLRQDQSRASNKYLRHPPKKFRVIVEMIIRTSCFYSFETLLNSENLTNVNVAIDALNEFIQVQMDDEDMERLDFTPLFPVLLSLCRKGFVDNEGLFKGHTSEGSIRRRGDNGAKRLLLGGWGSIRAGKTSTYARQYQILFTKDEDSEELADIGTNTARLRTIGFKILSRLIEIMFTRMRTKTLRKRLEPFLDEISRTIFVCLKRMNLEKAVLEKQEHKEKERVASQAGLSFLGSEMRGDAPNSESTEDGKENENEEEDVLALPRKRGQRSSVIIHGQVLAIDEDGAVIEDAAIDPEKPLKPPKPPKPDKKGKILLKQRKGNNEDSSMPSTPKPRDEDEERQKLRAEALQGIEEDIEEELRAASREELFESAPYAWRSLQYLAGIPSVPAVCALTMRFIAVFDDEMWSSQELIVSIFRKIVETASATPGETSMDTENGVPLVHVRNAPIEHLLLIHAERLACDHTTLTPMHKYYNGYSELITKSGRETQITPNSVGSEQRARNHIQRLRVLDRVLTVANILLEEALATPETTQRIKASSIQSEDIAISPLVERMHPSMSPRADSGDHRTCLRRRDLSEFFQLNLHALLKILWHASMWYPCDHFTITEMELPADHHANESIARLDAEARQHVLASNAVTVKSKYNEEIVEQIDNSLEHTYAALTLLLRDYKPQTPEQVKAILPQIMYFCSETSASHTLLEHDESTGRQRRLTPHLLRFRTVIAHAVNITVAECVERFGDCASNGSKGYWATVPEKEGENNTVLKPHPHLFTDESFAHLMVAFRSPDWQVVRQVTVVLLNLLEERLIYGVEAYEESHLHPGATELDKLNLKFAPLTELQLCMFHDVAFTMLCAFCGEQALILSSIWCVHASLIQAFGEDEICASIPFVLALEEYWVNFPKSVKATKPAFRSRCVEMMSCQRLYFLVFWFKVADFYESAALRRFCVSLLSSWAGVGKLPKSLNMNIYDIELCAVVVESNELHSKTESEIETLSIGSRVDKNALLKELLDSDRAKLDQLALEEAFAAKYLPEEPLTRVFPEDLTMDYEDEEGDTGIHHARSLPPKSPRRPKTPAGISKTPGKYVNAWMKNVFGHAKADVGTSGPLYDASAIENVLSVEKKPSKSLMELGRGFFNSPLPPSQSVAQNDQNVSCDETKFILSHIDTPVANKQFTSPIKDPNAEESEIDDSIGPSAPNPGVTNESEPLEEPKSPQINHIDDANDHLNNAMTSLKHLEGHLQTEIKFSMNYDVACRDKLEKDLVKVQGQMKALELMIESAHHLKSNTHSREDEDVEGGNVARQRSSSILDSSFLDSSSGKLRSDIVKENMESAMNKARKTIRSVRRSVDALKTYAGSLSPRKFSSKSGNSECNEEILAAFAAGDGPDSPVESKGCNDGDISPRSYSRSSKMRSLSHDDDNDDDGEEVVLHSLSSVQFSSPTPGESPVTKGEKDEVTVDVVIIKAAEDCQESNRPRSTKMRPDWEAEEMEGMEEAEEMEEDKMLMPFIEEDLLAGIQAEEKEEVDVGAKAS